MKKKSIYLLLILISVSWRSFGLSYLGGEITWSCVGQDSFILTMKLYRDCNGGPMMPVTIRLSNASTGDSLQSLVIPVPSPVDITPSCPHLSCTRCDAPQCSYPYGIEEYNFQKLLLINPSINVCELRLSFEGCCRSEIFTNITQGQNFYLESMMNRCQNPCDNSVTFSNKPVMIICLGQDIAYCQGINDRDVNPTGGMLDSFGSEWTMPLTGHGKSVGFISPFTYDKPIRFWGFPNDTLSEPMGFHLSKTACNIFRPYAMDKSVMAVKISEYRQGKFIGAVTREMAIFVIICPTNHAPILSGPFYKEVLAGNQVQFSIATNDFNPSDTLRISWNAAIPGATWSDNNEQVKHPTGLFTWKTKASNANNIPYTFTVTVKDDACPVNESNTRMYQILVKNTLSSVEIMPKPLTGITIVPNPSKDKIWVSYDAPAATISNYRLYNLLGKLCQYKGDILTNSFVLSRHHLPAGVYILKITDNRGKSGNFKLVFE